MKAANILETIGKTPVIRLNPHVPFPFRPGETP